MRLIGFQHIRHGAFVVADEVLRPLGDALLRGGGGHGRIAHVDDHREHSAVLGYLVVGKDPGTAFELLLVPAVDRRVLVLLAQRYYRAIVVEQGVGVLLRRLDIDLGVVGVDMEPRLARREPRILRRAPLHTGAGVVAGGVGAVLEQLFLGKEVRLSMMFLAQKVATSQKSSQLLKG